MSNLGDLLASGGNIARYATALPKILRLLEIVREADEIIGELREAFGGHHGAAPAPPATSASITVKADR